MADAQQYAREISNNPDDQSILSDMAYSSWNPIPYISGKIAETNKSSEGAKHETPFAEAFNMIEKPTEVQKPLPADQGFYKAISTPQTPLDLRLKGAEKALEGLPEYIPDTKYLAEAVGAERKIAGMADAPAKAYETAIKAPAAEYGTEIKDTQAELKAAKLKGEKAYTAKEAAITQALADHPRLSHKEVNDSYSFGQKLLIGALGGIGGNPNLFNQIVDRKVANAKEEFDNELTKLTALPNATLEHVNYTFDKAISVSNVDSRVLQAAKEVAERKSQEAKNPVDRLNAQKIAAQSSWQLELAKKTTQDLKNSRTQLTDAVYASAVADKDFISLGVTDSSGTPLGGYTKPEYTKEVMEAVPMFRAIYGEGGMNSKLINYLEKTGNPDGKDRQATNLFNNIIQTNPFKLEKGDYQKIGLDPTANYTNGEMMYYLKQIQDMNVLKFKNMTIPAKVDPRLIRAQLLKKK